MSSSVSGSSFTNTIRFTGMASGLDTESIVKQLMSVEKMPYTKLGQSKQLMQWTEDAYREQSTLLTGFSSSYFNLANPLSNMRSASIYKQFTSASSDPSVATVSGNTSAIVANHSLTVNKMATTSTLESAGSISVKSGSVVSPVTVTDTANTFSLSLAGTVQDITIDTGSYDLSDAAQKANLISSLQSSIDSKFGAGKISAAITSDNKLVFSPSDTTKSLIIGDGTTNKFNVTNLGFTVGDDLNNKINPSSTLSSFGLSGTVALKINGVSISIDSSNTLSTLINNVNTSGAGVIMGFNSLTGKFKLETKSTGVASANAFNATNLVDSNGLLAKIGLDGSTNSTLTTGQNSQYSLDGVSMSSGNNTFTQDGVSYTMVGVGMTKVSLSQNIDATVSKIKEFVGKYNDLIAEIQGKLDDKYDKDYAPLTDDQKAAMTSDDITKWEAKAKVGLLHNDSILQNVLSNMRNAISSPTTGVNYTLASVGITTGLWSDGGKLNIDEDKLRAALTNDIDGVTKLFTNESSKAYNPMDTSATAGADKQQRFNENGVVTRLYDILNDNVRTTNGKGTLLQKAGIKNDSTEYNNTIYNNINDITTRMTDMSARLTEKENAYYAKFANLETYMNKMNSQSSWLTSQLSKM